VAEGSGLRVNGDKREEDATAQKLGYGFAAVPSRYTRRDLYCVCTEHLRGVDVWLILDQLGELITCPIQQEDGAHARSNPSGKPVVNARLAAYVNMAIFTMISSLLA
jgi:hypothetical protein